MDSVVFSVFYSPPENGRRLYSRGRVVTETKSARGFWRGLVDTVPLRRLYSGASRDGAVTKSRLKTGVGAIVGANS